MILDEPIQIGVTDFDIAKKYATWGTYGKKGDEPLRFMRLCECESSHLRKILSTQKGISDGYVKIIEAILEDRDAVAEIRKKALEGD